MLYRGAIGLAATAVLCMSLGGAQAHDETKYPDWAGKWRRVEGGPPRYDPSKPRGRGQEPPLTAEWQAVFEASLAAQAAGGQGGDTTYQCIPVGMPRQMTSGFPVELVITPKTTYVLYELSFSTTRRIFTDGRAWPKDEEPTFAGYSIGRWLDTDGDGRYDTLEVETRNMKGPRQFDNSGIPLHPDNETVIKERIFADKTDKNILARRTHHLRPCFDPAVDGDEELSPRPCRNLAGGQLLGKQQSRRNRQGRLFSQRRRLPDADPQGPGAAGSALFQADGEIAGPRPNTVHLTRGCARPLSPRRSSRRGERVRVRGRYPPGLRGDLLQLPKTIGRAVCAGTCPSPQPSPHREERWGEGRAHPGVK